MENPCCLRHFLFLLVLLQAAHWACAVNLAGTDGRFQCPIPGRTHIYSPRIPKAGTDCPTLVGALPDFGNLVYRQECQRWLGLAALPDLAKHAFINNCQDNGDGSVTYQAELCCQGLVSERRCFVCPESDSHYECNFETGHFEDCAVGEVCQTTYTYYTDYPSTQRKVSKSCAPQATCQAASTDTASCRHWIPAPSCAYCCQGSFCNYLVDEPFYHVASTPCVSRPCYNGGTCTDVDANTYTCACRPGYGGVRCETRPVCAVNPCYSGGTCEESSTAAAGYICHCHPGRYGDRCQYTNCLNSGSWALDSTAADGYICYCRPGFGGDKCAEIIPQCASGTALGCLNGGTCMDYGSYGLRCRCPDGYIGQYCERAVRPCFYSVSEYDYALRFGIVGSGSCTDFEASRHNYLSLTNSYYRSRCKQRLGPPGGEDFVDTVHGNIPSLESTLISTCERGEVWGLYTETFCCPSCYTLPCLNNGWCIQNPAGDYICQCRFGIEGRHCQYIVNVTFIIGDPHYMTLDGQMISYQGLCKHTLVESIDAEAPYFRVDARNQRRGSNDRVAFPKYYEVTVYDHVIRLSEGKEVYLDGTLVFPDIIYPGFKVIYNGRFLRLETDFGLAVEFDGRWTAVVKLPPDIDVQGMAGDNDGNPSNDLVTKEQVDVTDDPMSFSLIGNSWQVDDPEDPGCTAVAEANLPDCVEPLRTQFAAADVCGALVDASGAFSSCLANAAMDPDNFFDACLYDMCANNGDAAIMEEARCGSAEAMAARCANLGHVIDWRDALNCPLACPEGMTYEFLVAACPATCQNPDGPELCHLPKTERCVCSDNKILHENRCINGTECGCYERDGTSHEIGDQWLSENCQIQFSCEVCETCERPVTTIVETDNNCALDEICVMVDGRTTCRGNDFCNDISCQNGGSCMNTHCACAAGYEGDYCETDIDECADADCQNGGTCVDGVNGYTCTCVEGFVGDNCERQFCGDSDPCVNGGTCRGAYCDCVTGFEGDHCASDIDDCVDVTCHNGGTCVDQVASYTCSCAEGFTGQHCEWSLTPCTVGWGNPRRVSTFDGATYNIPSKNKFLLAQNVQSHTDQCKFQVHVDTVIPRRGRRPVVSWVGVAFGIHGKNSRKFERNFRISRRQGTVELRGRGVKPRVKPPGCYQTGAKPLPWQFCFTQSNGVVVVTASVPARGCWVTVTYEESGAAVNPTNVDRLTIDTSDNYRGSLTGYCGNRDEDASNDRQFCGSTSGAGCIDKD